MTSSFQTRKEPLVNKVFTSSFRNGNGTLLNANVWNQIVRAAFRGAGGASLKPLQSHLLHETEYQLPRGLPASLVLYMCFLLHQTYL